MLAPNEKRYIHFKDKKSRDKMVEGNHDKIKSHTCWVDYLHSTEQQNEIVLPLLLKFWV